MNLCRDRHIRNYCLYLLGFAVLLSLSLAAILVVQEQAAKTLVLSYGRSMASSLLEQGVPEDIAASAITSRISSQEGFTLLSKLGMTEKTLSSSLPFLSSFHRAGRQTALLLGILLIVLLFSGTGLFLRKRDRLFCLAADTVSAFIDGDFSAHLPQGQEGTVFRLFSSIERLAVVLQSKIETNRKTKEFLKHTISDISHQLKTPLAALSMYQEIIANEPNHPNTVHEFAEKAGFALRRMEQLIQAMLKITRLDTGSIVFEKRPVPIVELITRSVGELTTRAASEQKDLCLDGAAGDQIYCDPHWTGEAIGNLVKNALDHTEPGGVIRVSWECSPSAVRIIISDNGTGIDPEDIHHIFKRFYRSKKSLDTQGVGLGLPLAKSIVEGQGGILSVRSRPGQGTAFTLSFLTEL